jgi:hypothetical protein
VLDVIFRLTIWPPVVDVIGTGGTASIVAGISYETIMRGLDVDSKTGSDTFRQVDFGSSTQYVSYDGDLGSLTDASPQGSSGPPGLGGGLVVSSYVPGSKELVGTFNASLTQWNTATDEIRSIKGDTNHFSFQVQYDATAGGAKIPKDSTQIMDLSWKISWDRKP